MNFKKQYMIRNKETKKLLSSIIFEDKESTLNYIIKNHLENSEIISRTVSYSEWKACKNNSENKEITSLHFLIFEKLVKDNVAEVASLIAASTPFSTEEQDIIKATWPLEEGSFKLKLVADSSILSDEYHYYYSNGYVRQVKVSKKELEFDYILEDVIIDTKSLLHVLKKYKKEFNEVLDSYDFGEINLA